jgi:uncharacterized protein (TIGR00297 family)
MFLDLVTGAALSVPFAIITARVGRVSTSGAAVGLLIASIVYAAFYLAGFAVLGTALVLTIASSRMRRARTQTAVQPDDIRGAANVAANCAVGTIAAALELAGAIGPEATALWFVTAIAAGASDTVASEIGRAYGGNPLTFPSWRRTSPGTAGAISAAGTMAGVVAAGVISSPAAILWLVSWTDVFVVMAACTVGSFVESALATAFETRNVLGNNTLNILNTASSAATATGLAAIT